MAKHTDNRGFTIIEVLIVLAIASLMMLVIFLAVPTLQSSQRDSRRKRDLTTFYNAVQTYQNNNRQIGQNPFDGSIGGDQARFQDFISRYLGSEFDEYEITLTGINDTHLIPYKADHIVYYPGHYCPDEIVSSVEGPETPGHAVTGWGAHPRFAWTVLISLERTESYLCLDQGHIET